VTCRLTKREMKEKALQKGKRIEKTSDRHGNLASLATHADVTKAGQRSARSRKKRNKTRHRARLGDSVRKLKSESQEEVNGYHEVSQRRKRIALNRREGKGHATAGEGGISSRRRGVTKRTSNFTGLTERTDRTPRKIARETAKGKWGSRREFTKTY